MTDSPGQSVQMPLRANLLNDSKPWRGRHHWAAMFAAQNKCSVSDHRTRRPSIGRVSVCARAGSHRLSTCKCFGPGVQSGLEDSLADKRDQQPRCIFACHREGPKDLLFTTFDARLRSASCPRSGGPQTRNSSKTKASDSYLISGCFKAYEMRATPLKSGKRPQL
jgi:hypothetical protein